MLKSPYCGCLFLLHCLLPSISTNTVCTPQLWPSGCQRHVALILRILLPRMSSSSSSFTLSVYNDIARSTISLQICLFCAIFSCSFTCIVLKLPSLLFFTNVLNSTFSKSFSICLIHVNFCPPLVWFALALHAHP